MTLLLSELSGAVLARAFLSAPATARPFVLGGSIIDLWCLALARLCGAAVVAVVLGGHLRAFRGAARRWSGRSWVVVVGEVGLLIFVAIKALDRLVDGPGGCGNGMSGSPSSSSSASSSAWCREPSDLWFWLGLVGTFMFSCVEAQVAVRAMAAFEAALEDAEDAAEDSALENGRKAGGLRGGTGGGGSLTDPLLFEGGGGGGGGAMNSVNGCGDEGTLRLAHATEACSEAKEEGKVNGDGGNGGPQFVGGSLGGGGQGRGQGLNGGHKKQQEKEGEEEEFPPLYPGFESDSGDSSDESGSEMGASEVSDVSDNEDDAEASGAAGSAKRRQAAAKRRTKEHAKKIKAKARRKAATSQTSAAKRRKKKKNKKYAANLGRLWKLASKDLTMLLLAFLALLVAAIGQSIIPYLTGQIVNSVGVDKPNIEVLKRLTLTLTVTAAITAIFTALRGSTFTVAMARFNIRLRKELLNSLLSQEVGFYDTTKTGDISSRISSDTTVMSDQISLNLNVLLRSIVQVRLVAAAVAFRREYERCV